MKFFSTPEVFDINPLGSSVGNSAYSFNGRHKKTPDRAWRNPELVFLEIDFSARS